MTKQYTFGLSCLFLIGALAAPNAFAKKGKKGKGNHAEHTRLRDDMSRSAKKNQWGGVDATFKKMEKLRGVDLCWDDYQLGAHAAGQLGQPDDKVVRYWKAQAVLKQTAGNCNIKASQSDVQNIKGALKEMQTAYGWVKVKASKGTTVKSKTAPFKPHERVAVEVFAKTIKSKGKFEGLAYVAGYSAKGKKNTSKFQVKVANWSKVNQCVSGLNKKKKMAHEKCLKKFKDQKIKIK